MADESYEVKLLDIFEGPLDLLVYLIRKNEVDIYDIPIALITDQYLAWIEMMKILNIDLAGDFILMAATLTQIKSKTLLPVHVDENDEEDPRLEIVRPLEEYLKIKTVAENLGQRNILGEDTFTRMPLKDETEIGDDDAVIPVGVHELFEAFRRILEKIPREHQVNISAEGMSIKDRISEIVTLLERKNSMAFDELFRSRKNRSDIIITFLAILEMARLELIRIVQNLHDGILRLFYV